MAIYFGVDAEHVSSKTCIIKDLLFTPELKVSFQAQLPATSLIILLNPYDNEVFACVIWITLIIQRYALLIY